MAMTTSAAMLVLVGLLVALFRSRSTIVRLAVEGGAFVAIILFLARLGLSPLLGENAGATARSPWIRALAIAWWLMGARLAVIGSSLAIKRDSHLRQARLFSDVLAAAIYVSAALVIVSEVLDLQLKALLATSGIFAVVLGLALQNTLSEFFSGLAVGLERPFGIGDVVSVGTNVTGSVVQTSWRSIWIETAEGDIVTIPNGTVAKSQLTNHSRPTAQRSDSVSIKVRSSWSTGRLTELLQQALLLCPTILAQPAPAVRLTAIGRKRLTFTITFLVADTSTLPGARGTLLRQVRRFLRHSGADLDQPVEDRPLADVGLFRHFPLERVKAIRAACRPRHLEPGAVLMPAGAIVDRLVIVEAGVLDVVVGSPSDKRPIGRVGPGEYLGEVSMMSNEPSPVTVSALTDVDVLELNRDDLVRLIDGDVAIAEALAAAVCRGIDVVERDRAAQASHPITDERNFLAKMARFLVPRHSAP